MRRPPRYRRASDFPLVPRLSYLPLHSAWSERRRLMPYAQWPHSAARPGLVWYRIRSGFLMIKW